MDIKKARLPEPVNQNFHPSPTMQVEFAGGVKVTMNRRERRRRGLYGDRLVVKKRTPTPPAIFHSLEERESLL